MAEGKPKKSEAERAALDERDRGLMRASKAGDLAARDKVLEILRADIGKIAKRRGRWLLRHGIWQDVCQQVRELFLDRVAKGVNLDEDKPIYFLASDLLKQVAQGHKTDVKWAKLLFSMEAPAVAKKQNNPVDLEADPSYQAYGYRGPHQLAAAREMAQWFVWADDHISDEDRELMAAIVAADSGEFRSLGEALGVPDGTARSLKSRFREKLARLAIAEGNLEMARRLAGKKYADAVNLLCVKAPGADHRIEELSALRDGELETAKKIELENHVKGCTGCRRTLRTLDAVDEAEKAFLVLPPDLIASVVKWPSGGRSKLARAVGVAMAALAALAWWLWPAKPAPKEKPPKQVQPAQPVPVPQGPDLAAPVEEPPDAGTRP